MSQTATLYHLQTLDSQIDDIRNRLSDVTRSLNEDDAVRAAQQALAEKEQMHRHWQQKQAEIERERTSLQEEAKSTEQRLYSGQVFNPRELTDLQDKLAELNHRREALEDPILEAMVMVEDLSNGVAQHRQALDKVLVERTALLGKLGDEQTSLNARLTELEALSSEARAEVERANLSIYDRLRKRPGGVSVVMIKGTECGACGVELTSQTIQRVRRGELLTCPTCGRILHI